MTLDEILAKLSEEEKAVVLAALAAAKGPVAAPVVSSDAVPVVSAEETEEERKKKELEASASGLAKRLVEKAQKEIEIEKAKADEAKGELVKLQKQVNELKEANRMVAFEKKAKELEYLPMAQVDIAKVLKKADDMGGKEGEALVKMLTNLNKASKASPILQEYGTSHEDGIVTPLQKQNNLVKEIQKANPKLSLEQAKIAVWKANPELYQQIQNEENGQ